MSKQGKKQTDFYEILNVSPTSSKTQIREAYIRLKNTFASHSQALYSLMSEEESQEMMTQIEEAFNVLKDDMRRKQYDMEMGWAQPDEIHSTSLPEADFSTPVSTYSSNESVIVTSEGTGPVTV